MKWKLNSLGFLKLIIMIGSLELTQINYAAATMVELRITNGLQMPISGAVVYVTQNGSPQASIGNYATIQFIELCKTGNNAERAKELQRIMPNNKRIYLIPGPTLSGKSQTINIQIENAKTDNIHYEVMYGKTKDVCGIATVNSHSLVALTQKVTKEVLLSDYPVMTGSFMEPRVPSDISYLDPQFCQESKDAIVMWPEFSGVDFMQRLVV